VAKKVQESKTLDELAKFHYLTAEDMNIPFWKFMVEHAQSEVEWALNPVSHLDLLNGILKDSEMFNQLPRETKIIFMDWLAIILYELVNTRYGQKSLMKITQRDCSKSMTYCARYVLTANKKGSHGKR
jgi:hypothetical protein